MSTAINNESTGSDNDVSSSLVHQFLTFILNGEEYGIGILHIREIIEYNHMTIVPLMPDFIEGVINLRGNVVPVVNLARRFGHEAQAVGKRTSIVVIDIKDNDDESVEVGIVVDVVNEVIELTSTDIAAAPAFGTKIRTDFIKGMGKVDDKLMILLDVDHVLSLKEISTIASMSGDTNDSLLGHS